MRVKIGPYKNWVGPYQIAEFVLTPLTWVKRNGKSEQDYRKEDEDYIDLCHKFGTWLSEDRNGNDSWLVKVCQWIESKKKRKVEIHIDNYDTWSMDATLSMIILPMLKQLKASKHGSPFVDDKDVPKHLRSTTAPAKENDWDIDGNHHARWDWVMDEMIWTFEQLNDDDNDAQFHTGTHETLLMPVDKNGTALGDPKPFGKKGDCDNADYYEVVKGPNDTSKFNKKAFEKHQKRIQNGLLLFGKYYRGLWD
jgi:hypothetical protein